MGQVKVMEGGSGVVTVTSLGSINAQSVQIVDSQGNQITSFGSAPKAVVSYEITRPADTPGAYGAKSVISSSTTAPAAILFTGACTAGLGGTIVKCRIITDDAAFINVQYRLHIFNAATANINDHAQYPLLYANKSTAVGVIDTVSSTEGTGSDSALAANYNMALDFKSVTGNLWGILEVLGATPAPAASKKFYIELTIE